jgi:hypothetical protein
MDFTTYKYNIILAKGATAKPITAGIVPLFGKRFP